MILHSVIKVCVICIWKLGNMYFVCTLVIDHEGLATTRNTSSMSPMKTKMWYLRGCQLCVTQHARECMEGCQWQHICVLAHLQQVLSAFGVVINNTGVSRDEKESLPPFRAQAVYTVNNILVETKTPVQCQRICRCGIQGTRRIHDIEAPLLLCGRSV